LAGGLLGLAICSRTVPQRWFWFLVSVGVVFSDALLVVDAFGVGKEALNCDEDEILQLRAATRVFFLGFVV
jgi:hypothetical protein